MFSRACAFIAIVLLIEIALSRLSSPTDPLPRWVDATALATLGDGGWAFDLLEQRYPPAQCYVPQLPRAEPVTAADRLVHAVVAERLTDPTWDARAARVLACVRVSGWDERVVRCAAGGSGRLAAHICHELVLAIADRDALSSLARHLRTSTDPEVRRRLAFGFARMAELPE